MPTFASCTAPWLVNSRVSALAARYDMASLVAPSNVSEVDFRSGVFVSGDGGNNFTAGLTTPTSPTTDMLSHVAPGCFVVHVPSQGPYIFALLGKADLTHAMADAANPRKDLVVARVYDEGNGGTGGTAGNRYAQVEIVTGTPGSSPVVPATPVGATPLSVVTIRAGATDVKSTDIDTSVRSSGLVARGGLRVCFTANDLAVAGAYPGETRIVPTSVFPVQYWGGATPNGDAKWHGAGGSVAYVVNAGLIQGGESARAQIATYTVQDPKVPYVAEVSGQAFCILGANVRCDVGIARGTISGSLITLDTNTTGGASTTMCGYTLAPNSTGVINAAETFVLYGQKISGPVGNVWNSDSATTNNRLHIRIFPA